MNKLKLIEAIMSAECGSEKNAPIRDGRIEIVILQRGWVVVGRVYRSENETRIEDASVIRKWGTVKGLGEIALGGPNKETILDKCGTVRSHPLAVVATIDCEEIKWK